VKKIKQNSNVLFFFSDSKKWLMKVSKNQQFHTHVGVIEHKKAIGKEYGSSLKTNKGKIIYLLEPTIYDYVMKSQRSTQIVYPKDLGYIAARTGLQSGQKIVEIGTGSGSLTTFLASLVKPRVMCIPMMWMKTLWQSHKKYREGRGRKICYHGKIGHQIGQKSSHE